MAIGQSFAYAVQIGTVSGMVRQGTIATQCEAVTNPKFDVVLLETPQLTGPDKLRIWLNFMLNSREGVKRIESRYSQS
jgi:hypothetical protein